MSESVLDQVIPTRAFLELKENLDYARNLVSAGRYLQHLKVGAFDVEDLYRAAVVQAVSALDHWVHSEVYDRAVGLAVQTSADRPEHFLRLTIPMQLFEDVHLHAEMLPDKFRKHLQGQLGYLSYQNPLRIKEAFRLVSDVSFWPGVAARLSTGGPPVTSGDIQEELRVVIDRRNAIAHSSDRAPGGDGRQTLTEGQTAAWVELIERIATAALSVLGPSPYQGEDEDAPTTLGSRWTKAAVQAAADLADPPVRDAIHRLLAHAQANGATFTGGTGAEPSAGLYYPTRGGRRSLWSLSRTRSWPSISINFPIVADVDTEIARRLIQQLRQVPSVDAALLDDDDALLHNKFPTLRLDAVAASAADLDRVISALDGVVKGWR